MMDIKKFRVKSKSEPGTYRTVKVLPNGKMYCSCPAIKGKKRKLCRHQRIVIKFLIKQGIAKIYAEGTSGISKRK